MIDVFSVRLLHSKTKRRSGGTKESGKHEQLREGKRIVLKELAQFVAVGNNVRTPAKTDPLPPPQRESGGEDCSH